MSADHDHPQGGTSAYAGTQMDSILAALVILRQQDGQRLPPGHRDTLRRIDLELWDIVDDITND